MEEAAREIPTVPTIAFVSGQRAGSEVPVGQQIVVGRDPGAADVVLDGDAEISRRHAAFSPAGAGLTVRDLGSINGTLVNGEQIVGTVALRTGDRIEVGSTVIDVRLARPIVIAPPPRPRGDAAEPSCEHDRGGWTRQGVRQLSRGRRDQPDGQPGRDLRLPRAERRGQVDDRPHADHAPAADLRCARIAGYDVVKQGSEVRATIGVALQEALDPHLNCWEHMDLQTALQGSRGRSASNVAGS